VREIFPDIFGRGKSPMYFLVMVFFYGGIQTKKERGIRKVNLQGYKESLSRMIRKILVDVSPISRLELKNTYFMAKRVF
jgi:hypothetical protein